MLFPDHILLLIFHHLSEVFRMKLPRRHGLFLFGIGLVCSGFWLHLTSTEAARPVSTPQVSSTVQPAAIWQDISESGFSKTTQLQSQRQIIPTTYRTLLLDKTTFSQTLQTVPLETNRTPEVAPVILAFPLPDKTFARFAVWESPIMATELAAEYPAIRTYAGRGIDDPTASIRFDQTPLGVHAMMISAQGTFYIDPYAKGNTELYICYNKRDFHKPAADLARCLIDPAQSKKRPSSGFSPLQADTTPPPSPTRLRIYRAAVSATGEYTQFHGSVANAQAAIVTTLNRVTQIYERELAIRLVLVKTFVFSNPETDPFNNDDAGAMIDQNIAFYASSNGIAASAYDVGHVLGVGGGGVALLGSVCDNSSKAGGVTTGAPPVGDPFDVDYVAHEFGHQFGADHTFNAAEGGACTTRNESTAFEPGSGSTIMGYTNICQGRDLQPASDDYFHAGSLKEILELTINGSGSCGQSPNPQAVNNPPRVTVPNPVVIPARTPFALTAVGTDLDAQDAARLTYCWEQYDLGEPGPPDDDNGNRPIFRSYSPSSNPTRVFPQLRYILNNSNTPPETYTVPNNEKVFQTGETLPRTNRVMRFRVTVRDNRVSDGSVAGTVGFGDTQIRVVADAGPFVVTEPVASTVWSTNSRQTVRWNTAFTDQAPINCTSVKITLSTDGGQTFPATLAENVPNNGTASVVVPDLPLTASVATARVRIESVGNIFFDITDTNFTLNIGSGGDLTPPQVTVFSPDGGEKLKSGRTFVLEWESVDDVGVATQEIRLSLDGAETFDISIATGLAGNVQSFDFTPPASREYRTKQAVLRVIATDAAGNSGSDDSDDFFRIK